MRGRAEITLLIKRQDGELPAQASKEPSSGMHQIPVACRPTFQSFEHELSIFVFCVVLFAAALHATWNAVVKAGTDKFLTTVLVMSSAALLSAVALPFVGAPARPSWPFILGSVLLQPAYCVLVAKTYHAVDMSQAYPLMRGSAPLIVAGASTLLLGGSLTPLAWSGISIICAGVLSMAFSAGRRSRSGVALALLNALVIASYTLIDGSGVRLSGDPAAYTLWIFLLTGLPLFIWTAFKRHGILLRHCRANWRSGMIGGIGVIASYGLALWAMTVAPIAVVAALRETAILFGIVISAGVLHERVRFPRMLATCLIALGAAILRFA